MDYAEWHILPDSKYCYYVKVRPYGLDVTALNDATREKIVKLLNRCSILLCGCALVIASYLASQGAGLIDGSFGPGSYYYSDIPNWEKIFLSDKTLHLGFDHPVIAYGFFIVWGLLTFKALLWLDKRIK